MLLWGFGGVLGSCIVVLNVGHGGKDGILSQGGHRGCCARGLGVCACEVRGSVNGPGAVPGSVLAGV